MRSATLGAPGAKLYYEVRGSGPVLVMMPGGPADAATFRKIEDILASRHTVITYDPRGLSHSDPFPESDDDRMVEIFAEDVHQLIATTGAGKADVFASSGGASIALELIKLHGDELGTVILHEPPTPDLMADAEKIRAAMEAVCDTCARDGMFAAMQQFMTLVGIQGGPPPAGDGGEPTAEQKQAMAMMQKNMQFFFSRYIRNIARYRPDFEALRSCRCRIVAAVGADSEGQLAHNGGRGLARRLGIEPAVFPGDHGGFDGKPEQFATKLLEVLAA